jgi:hypothetical protein
VVTERTATILRRNELDWLRVATILTVFFYHSGRFFDQGDWSVKNVTTSIETTQVLWLLAEWMMPLIFLISGASVFYAIGKGGKGRFLKDKVLRLLVPLVVCVFTHASLQVYLERVSHGQFQGPFFDFIPHYFDGLYFGTGGAGDGNFAFAGMHLWYLLILFLFCVIFLPLFFWLRGSAGSSALARVGDFFSLPAATWLLALPTIVLQNVIDPGSALGFTVGGWNLPHYAWFFIAGFLIYSSDRVRQRVRQMRWVALLLSLVVIGQNLLATGEIAGLHPDLASWCFIFTILGFGMEHFTGQTPFLRYASEAVLPFYILHQTMLLAVGFFVVQWPIADPLKYLMIMASSFITIVVIYEFIVRRYNPLRILFGMHPLPTSRAVLKTGTD